MSINGFLVPIEKVNSQPRAIHMESGATVGAVVKLICLARPNIDEERTIRIIARSHESCAFRSIWDHIDSLTEGNVIIRAVFTKPGRAREFDAFLQRFGDIFGHKAIERCVRVAKFRKADQLNEQILVGEMGVWSRPADKSSRHSAVDLKLELVDSGILDLSREAFEQVWEGSEPAMEPPPVYQRPSGLSYAAMANRFNISSIAPRLLRVAYRQ